MNKAQAEPDTVRFITTISADLRRDLKIEAAKRGTTMAALVEKAIKELLAK